MCMQIKIEPGYLDLQITHWTEIFPVTRRPCAAGVVVGDETSVDQSVLDCRFRLDVQYPQLQRAAEVLVSEQSRQAEVVKDVIYHGRSDVCLCVFQSHVYVDARGCCLARKIIMPSISHHVPKFA